MLVSNWVSMLANLFPKAFLVGSPGIFFPRYWSRNAFGDMMPEKYPLISVPRLIFLTSLGGAFEENGSCLVALFTIGVPDTGGWETLGGVVGRLISELIVEDSSVTCLWVRGELGALELVDMLVEPSAI